jgi:hypothetical protein
LSDSVVVLREKLMHGLPVRVVAVTNVDLKIMLRRTPTDSVSGRRRSPRASGSENASRYHPDLLERLHAAQAQPPHDSTHGPAASLASLQADLLAAHERAARLATRNQQLERRLSTALGQQPGASPGSPRRTTSTSSLTASPTSNNRSST